MLICSDLVSSSGGKAARICGGVLSSAFSSSSFSQCISNNKKVNTAVLDSSPPTNASRKPQNLTVSQEESLLLLCSEIRNKVHLQISYTKNTLSDRIILKAFLIYLRRLDQKDLYDAVKNSNCTFAQLRAMDPVKSFPFKNDFEKKCFLAGLNFMVQLDNMYSKEKVMEKLNAHKKIEYLMDENCKSKATPATSSNDNSSSSSNSNKLELVSSKVLNDETKYETFIKTCKLKNDIALVFDYHYKVRSKAKSQGSYACYLFTNQLNEKVHSQLLKESESKDSNQAMLNGLLKALKLTERFKSRCLHIITKCEPLIDLIKKMDNNEQNDSLDIDQNLLKLLKLKLDYRNMQFIKGAKPLKIFGDLQKTMPQ